MFKVGDKVLIASERVKKLVGKEATVTDVADGEIQVKGALGDAWAEETEIRQNSGVAGAS